MMVANVFYQFDGNPEDEGAWQAFVAANSEAAATKKMQTPSSFAPSSSIPSSSTAVKKLYELFLLFAVVVALVGTVIWHQKSVETASLEAEVQRLGKELVALAEVQEVATSAALAVATKPPRPHVIETDYLRFVVTEENTHVVHALSAELDRAYLALSTGLGVQADPSAEKLNILLYSDSADDTTALYTKLGVLVVDVSAYESDADTDLTAQAIYLDLYGQMARRILDRALSTRQILPTWRVLISHLYRDIEHPEPVQAVADLQGYELAKRHYAQRLSPASVVVNYEPGNSIYPDSIVADTVADPLWEYIFATYGTAPIPQLLDACTAYKEWSEVATAVFGLSAEEFQADWHAYLAETYPIDVNELQ